MCKSYASCCKGCKCSLCVCLNYIRTQAPAEAELKLKVSLVLNIFSVAYEIGIRKLHASFLQRKTFPIRV